MTSGATFKRTVGGLSIELMAELRLDPALFQTHISVAPNGSPVFTRDIGSQEIYALTVRWP